MDGQHHSCNYIEKSGFFRTKKLSPTEGSCAQFFCTPKADFSNDIINHFDYSFLPLKSNSKARVVPFRGNVSFWENNWRCL